MVGRVCVLFSLFIGALGETVGSSRGKTGCCFFAIYYFLEFLLYDGFERGLLTIFRV